VAHKHRVPAVPGQGDPASGSPFCLAGPFLNGLGSSTRSHLCSHGHLKVLPHHSDGISRPRRFCLYWWGWHGGFGRKPKVESLYQ